MASKPTDSATGQSSEELLVPGWRFLVYGLGAAGGTLALLSGSRNYHEYVTVGGPDSIISLVGIAVTLIVGLTLLLVALAGTVAIGVEHAHRSGPSRET